MLSLSGVYSEVKINLSLLSEKITRKFHAVNESMLNEVIIFCHKEERQRTSLRNLSISKIKVILPSAVVIVCNVFIWD